MSERIQRHWQGRARRGSAFLKAVSTLSLDAVIVVDAEGRIQYRSASTSNVLGYQDQDLLGHDFLEFAHPYDHPRIHKAFRHVSRMPGSSRGIEARIRTAEGGWVWLEARMSNLLDDPAVRGVVVNAVVIDERKTLEMRHAAAKLDPHFLYNVLHSIAGLVREGRGADAVEALALVRSLTEGTLAGADDRDVPLSEEWNWISDYVALERIRFGAELDVTIDPVPSVLADFPVPCRLVQPLVENAVKHGLRRRPGGGRLHLTAAAEVGCVRIRVHEEGSAVRASEPPVGFNIGLRTLRQRLALHFGHDADLTLDVDPACSTATLTLPDIPRASLTRSAS